MANHSPEWENQLREKPFRDNHFTPQMQERVEGQVKIIPRSSYRAWKYTAGICTLLAVMLGIGFSYSRHDLQQTQPLAPTADVSATANPQEEPPSGVDTVNRTISFPSSDGKGERIAVPLNVTEAVLSVDSEHGSGSIPSALAGLPEMDFPLPAALADQLQATLVYRPDGIPGYLLLSPTGWIPSASIGANGSFGVEFLDPVHPNRNMKFTDNEWSCGGCAVTDIGTYFPERAAWAEKQGFPVYDPLLFAERYSLGDSGAATRTARYKLQLGLDNISREGMVYYEEGEMGFLVRQLEFRMPATGQGAATGTDSAVMEEIYNYFTAQHGAISISSTVSNSVDKAADSPEALISALEQAGLSLTVETDTGAMIFNKELAGAWPAEFLIDVTDTPARPERLSIYSYGSEAECTAGLEALKLQINRNTFDGGARIYPQVFRGGNSLVVYWTGGDSEIPFYYDKAIKQVLKDQDSQ